MLKTAACFIIGCFIIFLQLPVHNFEAPVLAKVEANQPDYAKWGRLAMQKTKEKYPKASIIDYLHVERIPREKTTVERFKLWLKDQEREFGVFVTIEFESDTERVVNISFKEVTQ